VAVQRNRTPPTWKEATTAVAVACGYGHRVPAAAWCLRKILMETTPLS